MNTELTKKEKNNFESDLFKLVNNVVFGKTIESVRKYQDIELVTKEETILYPNQITKQQFSKNLIAIEMKKYRY